MTLQNTQIFTDGPGGVFKFFAFFCFAVACGLMAGSLQQQATSARLVSKPQPVATAPAAVAPITGHAYNHRF